LVGLWMNTSFDNVFTWGIVFLCPLGRAVDEHLAAAGSGVAATFGLRFYALLVGLWMNTS
jgi:hypothetical protein